MTTITIKGWVARDKDGTAYLYLKEKPYHKSVNTWWQAAEGLYEPLPQGAMPLCRWADDEPTEVDVTISINISPKK